MLKVRAKKVETRAITVSQDIVDKIRAPKFFTVTSLEASAIQVRGTKRAVLLINSGMWVGPAIARNHKKGCGQEQQ